MGGRIRRFAAVALIPTLVDVGLLVLLRQTLGWPLVAADLIAIGVASGLSYLLHRVVTFRSDPYVRWVEVPVAFGGVAALAAGVDLLALGSLAAGTGVSSTAALIEAKLVALAAAGVVRLAGYRWVLLGTLTRARQVRSRRPDPPGDRRLSIVLPAYGEADRIGDTVGQLRGGLHDVAMAGDLEIIVVDDGSPDGTADAALAAGVEQVIVQPRNRGKGAAVRAGVLAAQGRTVVFTDADLAYGPDQVRRILDAVEDGWDMAIGDRRHPDAASGRATASSRLRAWGSRAINRLVYAVLLGSYRDTQCGLKGFRSDVGRFVFSRTRIDRFAFDIELLHLAERHKLSVVELPVEPANPVRSTVRAARDAAQLVLDLFRIRHWSATGVYERSDDEHLPLVEARRVTSTARPPG